MTRRVLGVVSLVSTLACSSADPIPTATTTRAVCSSTLCNVGFLPDLVGDDDDGWLMLIGDRSEYRDTDGIGQFVGGFFDTSVPTYATLLNNPDSRITISIRQGGTQIAAHTLSPPLSRKVAFEVGITTLSAGSYTARMRLHASGGTTHYEVDYPFTKSSATDATTSFPSGGIPIYPHTIPTGIEAGAWPIRTGIPMPRGALTGSELDRLVIEENGVPIRSRTSTRATWSPDGPVKWLGLEFVARWDDGVPRSYILHLRSSAPSIGGHQVVVTESMSHYFVDNGVVRTTIAKGSFGGFIATYFDSDGNGIYESDEQALEDKGGPYIVDANGVVYYSGLGGGDVVLEESSPYGATFLASGQYGSESDGNLGEYVVRFTMVAGQPWIDVDHRTIITFDTDDVQLSDVGFTVKPDFSGSWTVGLDDDDVESGSTSEAYVHQDTGSTFHVSSSGSDVATGNRAAGWIRYAESSSTTPAVTLMMRDFYEKFPKELELTHEDPRDPSSSGATLVAHFWPRHGHQSFFGDTTAQGEIYKLRWAHEGELMDLEVPTSYITALDSYWTPAEETDEGQLASADAAKAQGVAISNSFAVHFSVGDGPLRAIQDHARIHEQSPHALASPEWNVDSGVLGLITAAPSSAGGPGAERALELALPEYKRAVIDTDDEYGMWIYGGVHNNWNPDLQQAQTHRVWQNSHYQNVWTSLMLYFRSGRAADYEFSRIHSQHFLDIGTLNSAKDNSPNPFVPGAMYHCKGFVPWGGANGLAGHWIDPSAHLLRYYLFGDLRARDVYEMWRSTQYNYRVTRHVAEHNENCAAWIPTPTRDEITSLGEVVEACVSTWDPRLLFRLAAYAQPTSHIMLQCTSTAPSRHPLWSSQWYRRYHELTRAQWVVDNLAAYDAAFPGDPALSAFLSRTTGTSSYVTRDATRALFYDTSLVYYDNPGDLYHGYGRWYSALHTQFLQKVPYYLGELERASASLKRGTRPVTYPGAQLSGTFALVGGVPQAPPHTLRRGWSSSSQYVYFDAGSSTSTWHLALARAPGHDIADIDAVFMRSSTTGEVLPDYQTTQYLYDVGETFIDGERLRESIPSAPVNYPWVSASTSTASGLHHFEAKTGSVMSFYAPYRRNTTAGAEALVMQRWFYINGNVRTQKRYQAVDRQLFWIQPYEPEAYGSSTITLEFIGNWGKQNQRANANVATPAYVRIEDSAGDIVFETSLFRYGVTTATVTVTLPTTPADVNGRPPKYRLYASSAYGPSIALTGGAAELLVSVGPDELDTIYGALQTYAPITCSLTCGQGYENANVCPNPCP